MTEQVKKQETTEIDLLQIFYALLRRIWLIAIFAIVFAVAGFLFTKLFITPKYSTTFTAYVNNHNSSDVLTSLNSGDLSARVTLANTTSKIATSTTVKAKVCQQTGVYPDDVEIRTNVDTTSSILTVRVIMADQSRVLDVAKSLAVVLADETGRIVEGSSVQIIDSPREPDGRYSPSYSRNVLLAALIGAVIAAIIIIILELLDDTLKDASELEEKYGIPVVGSIPDFASPNKGSGYKKGYGYGGYGYGYAYRSKNTDPRMTVPGMTTKPADEANESEE